MVATSSSTSSGVRKFLWGATGALLLIYIGAAVSQNLPRKMNLVCAIDAWQDTFDQCKPDANEMMKVLPPCPLERAVLNAEKSPVHYLQLYWELLSCGQAADAWSLQTVAYRNDNTKDGLFDNFESFVTTHKDFEVIDARDTKIHSALPAGSSTAKLEIQLVYRNRVGDLDITDCSIEYVLTRAPGASWVVEDSDSHNTC